MALPAIAPLIGGAILYVVSGVVFRALSALGIGYVTYRGLDYLLNFIRTEMQAAMTGLPPQLFDLVGYLQIGTAFNIILSACVIRFTMRGFSMATGAITAWLISKDHL